ncbi:hypothetical protein ACULNC_05890 [Shigella flexneri]
MLALNMDPVQQQAAERGSRTPRKFLKTWRWRDIKVTGNGRRTPPTVCLPA